MKSKQGKKEIPVTIRFPLKLKGQVNAYAEANIHSFNGAVVALLMKGLTMSHKDSIVRSQ